MALRSKANSLRMFHDESRLTSASTATDDETFGSHAFGKGTFSNGSYVMPTDVRNVPVGIHTVYANDRRDASSAAQLVEDLTSDSTSASSVAVPDDPSPWNSTARTVSPVADFKSLSFADAAAKSVRRASPALPNTTSHTSHSPSIEQTPSLEDATSDTAASMTTPISSMSGDYDVEATPQRRRSIGQSSAQPNGETPVPSTKTTTSDDSPFLQDLLDRLIRVELSLFPLRDLAAQYASLRADVDFLLRAQRQQSTLPSPAAPTRPGSSASSAVGLNIAHHMMHAPPQSEPSVTSGNLYLPAAPDAAAVKQLTSQMSTLSGTVAQLMSLQAQQQQQQHQNQQQSQSHQPYHQKPVLTHAQTAYEPRQAVPSSHTAHSTRSQSPSDRRTTSMPGVSWILMAYAVLT